MSAHTKMHPIEKVAMITWHGAHYAVPIDVIDRYKLPQEKDDILSIEDVFGDLISEYGESRSLLKGLRRREGLSQIEFAKKINITQTNLSAIENGRRSIGKELAKRISEAFNIDYRILL